MLTSAEVILPMIGKICTLTCCLPLVYQKLGYIEIVGRAAEMTMRASVEEVQALPEYSTKGEVHVASDCKLNTVILSSPPTLVGCY